MDWFALIALIVTGFTACAEFGSYAFVHPVVRRLPANYHIQVVQGLLKTFGRVMTLMDFQLNLNAKREKSSFGSKEGLMQIGSSGLKSKELG
jgi:hypothetical protein